MIEFNNIHLRYDNSETDTLKNISFSLQKGEIVGYIGPNGSGKTTTMKTILGLISPYKGNIRILNESLKKGSRKYKSKIGYMPENIHLYENLCPKDYFEFLAQIYGLNIEKSLKRAYELMKYFDIENVYTGRLKTFSKGMKQKFMLICSMLHNPEIYLFDEPLSGMDVKSVLLFKELIKNLKDNGKLIFYSSHLIDIIEKVCDRIIIINEGEIAASDKLDNIKNSKDETLEEVYKRVSNSETDIKKDSEKLINIIQEI